MESRDLIQTAIENSIKNNASDLFDLAAEVFKGKSEAQIAFIQKVAILKSVDVSELSMEELSELSAINREASDLAVEINADLNNFWAKFGMIVKSVATEVGNVTAKAVAIALRGLLPI